MQSPNLPYSYTSTQLSKLGLPLHVNLFLRNMGGLVNDNIHPLYFQYQIKRLSKGRRLFFF